MNIQTLEPGAHQASASMVLLHGLGADGRDLLPVAQALNLPEVRFILPDAPIQPVSLNNGYPMRSWFDLYGGTAPRRQDDAGLLSARAMVQGLVEQEINRGIAPNRILLGGFSQGGALALFSGLTLNYPFAGVVGLSTWLPDVAHKPDHLPAVWLAHGLYDSILPLAASQASYAHWPELTSNLHTWPMDHEICAEEIEMLGTWIASRLAGQPAT